MERDLVRLITFLFCVLTVSPVFAEYPSIMKGVETVNLEVCSFKQRSPVFSEVTNYYSNNQMGEFPIKPQNINPKYPEHFRYYFIEKRTSYFMSQAPINVYNPALIELYERFRFDQKTKKSITKLECLVYKY